MSETEQSSLFLWEAVNKIIICLVFLLFFFFCVAFCLFVYFFVLFFASVALIICTKQGKPNLIMEGWCNSRFSVFVFVLIRMLAPVVLALIMEPA